MRRTETTLLEQLQISDAEIDNRKNLLGLTNESLEQLASYRLLIEENIDVIVNEFYETQTEIDEISMLIGDLDTLTRLRNAQRKYVIDLFSGNYDGEYVNNRLRIGLVHKRIGVEPKLYLSAVKTLKELITKVLSPNISNENALDRLLDTLDKLFYFDTTLVFDTYIDSLVNELESAKRKTEAYAKSLEEKVAERTRQLKQQTRLDPLTNTYNRRAMQDILRREISAAKRRETTLSLVYIDIDDFKSVNDSQGHIKGDEILKYLGHIMLDNIRESDLACRYGGDEFCVIFPECNAQQAKTICQKIIQHFNDKFFDTSLSIGIEQIGPENYVDSESLIKSADEKMYKAKQESGNAIVN